MKLFEMPCVEVVKFTVADVITTSGTTPTLPALMPPCNNG